MALSLAALQAPISDSRATNITSSTSTSCRRQRFGFLASPQQSIHPQHRLPAPLASLRKDDGSLDQLEIEVPADQRPVNELAQLKSSLLYSWATLELGEYAKRLTILWGGAFTLLAGPIAYQTFDPLAQPAEFFLSASTGSLLVVAVASLRIYLGWKYVADRLMTATLEYEETGWYDGQFFVKPPEILTRDRLLGTYEVRPVMARLRRTLQGTGLLLAGTSLALTVAIRSGTDADGVYGRGSMAVPKQVTDNGILLSAKVKSLDELITDDDAAQAEAEALGGVPGYCYDRRFKAIAGGERVCEKFERGRSPPPDTTTGNRSHETDVVIIGSGIGGLCCAAILARYGYKVTVCESHYHAGGAAHGFDVAGYQFDAGPSFFAGLSGPVGQPTSNPLKQVLDAVGESVECITYNNWVVYSPDGTFPCVCDGKVYADTIRRIGGENAHRQWLKLEEAMAPLQQGAALFPAAAIRSDTGVVLTAARFGPALLKTAFMVGDLTGPFSNLVDRVVTDPWLRNFLDLECFVLSGMLAKDTICAEMAFMMMERNSGNSTIDYPIGGSKAIVDALVRGIQRYGGRVLLRTAVDEVIIEGGKATGVNLRPQKGKAGGAEVIKARRAVVSNASVWDTARLVPPHAAPAGFAESALSTPRTGSFMHLHLGIDATGLPADLDCHHLFVNSWEDLDAPQNVCIASIPTVFDPELAPPGKAVVHAYTAGNEPYEIWEGVDPGSAQYKALKEERTQCLWQALERVIPDIRQRAEVQLAGTPLTHARFLNRYKGTYGPAISAATGAFPGPQTSVPGLYRCGDSCAPGIGVPAAAASGMIAANTIAPVWSHLKLLDSLNL